MTKTRRPIANYPMLVLSSQNVADLVDDIPLSTLTSITQNVFVTLSHKQDVATPHRISLLSSNHKQLYMPSRMGVNGTGIKIVSIPLSPHDTSGLPATTVLIDEDTAQVKAVINARALTALRTAGGSLLATQLVGPSEPKSLVVFGAGKQAEAHIDLHLRYFKSLNRCTVINRSNNPRLEDLLVKQRKGHPDVTFASLSFTYIPGSSIQNLPAQTTVSSADIICAATSSQTPLFPSSWIPPDKRVHLNLVGSYTPAMHEVDSDLIRRAPRILVDSREACSVEAGELISAMLDPQASLIEMGELFTLSPDDGYVVDAERIEEVKGTVTIFKSVGVGLQDVAIADAILGRAEALGVGTRIDNYDTM